MQIDVVNGNNETVGAVELNDAVFGGRVKSELIWEAVVQENASDRRGTHATKNRAAVSGSGKKPWRQKGTGRARVGEIRNPLWRKGGTVFGPMPRSYAYDLPKKVRRGALARGAGAEAQRRRGDRRRSARGGRSQDEDDRRDVQAAGRDGQDARDRRDARRRLHALGPQHRRREARGEQPGDRRATSSTPRASSRRKTALEKLQEALA